MGRNVAGITYYFRTQQRLAQLEAEQIEIVVGNAENFARAGVTYHSFTDFLVCEPPKLAIAMEDDQVGDRRLPADFRPIKSL